MQPPQQPSLQPFADEEPRRLARIDAGMKPKPFLLWSYIKGGTGKQIHGHTVAVVKGVEMPEKNPLAERLQQTELWIADESCKKRQHGTIRVSQGLRTSLQANASETFSLVLEYFFWPPDS